MIEKVPRPIISPGAVLSHTMVLVTTHAPSPAKIGKFETSFPAAVTFISVIVPVGVFDAPSAGEDPAPSEPEKEPALSEPGEELASPEHEKDETTGEAPEVEDSGDQGEEASEETFDGHGNWGVDAAFGAAVGDLLTSKINKDPTWGSEPLWLSSLLEQEAGMEKPEAGVEERGEVGEDDEKSGGESEDSPMKRREGDQADDSTVG